jgi:hypothetical protein
MHVVQQSLCILMTFLNIIFFPSIISLPNGRSVFLAYYYGFFSSLFNIEKYLLLAHGHFVLDLLL